MRCAMEWTRALQRRIRTDRDGREERIERGVSKCLRNHTIKICVLALKQEPVPEIMFVFNFESLGAFGRSVHISPEGRSVVCNIGWDADGNQRARTKERNQVIEIVVEKSDAQKRASIPQSLLDSKIEGAASFRPDGPNVILRNQSRTENVDECTRLLRGARFLDSRAKIEFQFRFAKYAGIGWLSNVISHRYTRRGCKAEKRIVLQPHAECGEEAMSNAAMTL